MTSTDYSRLRSFTARQIIHALERDDFWFDRARGSHHHYMHADGRRVTVIYKHPSQTFKMGTLHSMIEYQARWTESDLRRLKLLK
ncbi:type II toxin-antitoxin system HicA family toxin [Candidatus Acetothermia bacterium]|nr:type II toxin-antitoxin system HicA family toxin [Candidatus Acetothermia bacterium]